MLGGQASLQRRVFGGGFGVGSKRVAEREVPALPRASDLAYMDVHEPRIAVVVPPAQELVLGLDGVDAV